MSGAPVILTLFYSQTAVDRLGLDESTLELLYFNASLNQWEVVGVSGRSTLMNWVASTEITASGIYAIGWRPIPPPVANFEAFPLSGPAPLLVNFTNLSDGIYTSSFWEFGDGMTSTATNPSHLYQSPGIYTVRLTVAGPGGESMLEKTAYITVK